MTFPPANVDQSIDPTADQVRALRDAGRDSPVVMLNCLTLRERPNYPVGSPHSRPGVLYRALLRCAVMLTCAVPLAHAADGGFEQALGRGRAGDLPGAQKGFERCAAQGDARCAHGLGQMHEAGAGMPADLGQARQWYGRAARLGHLPARGALGRLTLEQPGSASDNRQALAWLEEAAAGGDLPSLRTLVVLHTGLIRAWGVPADESEAARHTLAAALLGDVRMQAEIGRRFRDGLGVAPDGQQARHWLRTAASAGEPSALRDLGRLYLEGRGVPAHRAAAVALWAAATRADGMQDTELATLRATLTPAEQAAQERLQRAVAGGTPWPEALRAEVQGTAGADTAPLRMPHYWRYRRSGVPAAELASRTARQVCADLGGISADDTEAAVVSTAPASSTLACLYAPVDLDCVPPSPRQPDWPRPVFDSPADDRCDTWRRGPAPEAGPWPPDDEDAASLGRTLVALGRAVDIEPARRPEIEVLNLEVYNPRGVRSPWPGARLDTVLAGREALAVTWAPDCPTCDRLLDALHQRIGRRVPMDTTSPDARLFIMLPGWPFNLGAQEFQAVLARLNRRYPGRPVLFVAGKDAGAPPGHRDPVVRLFDRHGLQRGVLSSSTLGADGAGGALVDQPYAWLDFALRQAVWRSPEPEVTLAQVLRQYYVLGRLPLAPESAPERIVLPADLLGPIDDAIRASVQRGLEFGAYLAANGSQPVLTPAVAGYSDFVIVTPDDISRRLRAAATPGDRLRWVGLFHTHPNAAPFSMRDLDNARQEMTVSILGLPSGHLMLALPTHDQLRGLPATNPKLGGLRPWLVRQQRVQSDLMHPFLADTFRPRPNGARIAARHPELGVLFSTEAQRSHLAAVLSYARLQGLAIYAGRDGRLDRLDYGDDTPEPSWTGRGMSTMPATETGLAAAERVLLSAVVRGMNGDREAFCRVRESDALAESFSAEVRALIQRLPGQLRALDPAAPPMSVASQGHLNDPDLVTLLELASRLDVQMFQGHLAHRSNPACKLIWARSPGPAGAPPSWSLRLGAALPIPGRVPTDPSDYGFDGEGKDQLVHFGSAAQAEGCRGVAIVSRDRLQRTRLQCDQPS
jgi:TPR repeat protein